MTKRPLDSFQRFAMREELDTPQDAVVIVQISRMEALKGHKVHLEALGKLRDLPNWICWMVGAAQRNSEITYAREVEALATKFGISQRVKFLGERSDVANLLNA